MYSWVNEVNYTVSSIAADWYFNQKVTRGLFAPYFKIFRYHLGSIYYGSFVSALFEPISFLQSVTSVSTLLFSLENSRLERIELALLFGCHA